MYIVFGNEIIDSSEIKDIIENNSDFNVEKDLTKGSKREDTLAYQISIDVALLNEVIKESYELDSIDEEELFDEYMTLSDELAMELEEYMPEQLSEEELNKIIDKVFLEVKPTSMKDMGNIMKAISPLVKGKADMSDVNKLIKERLS